MFPFVGHGIQFTSTQRMYLADVLHTVLSLWARMTVKLVGTAQRRRPVCSDGALKPVHGPLRNHTPLRGVRIFGGTFY